VNPPEPNVHRHRTRGSEPQRVRVEMHFRSLGAVQTLLAFGIDAEVLTPPNYARSSPAKPPKPLPFPPPPATERAATNVRRECDHPATIRAHLVD
jgi:hypothetical protein